MYATYTTHLVQHVVKVKAYKRKIDFHLPVYLPTLARFIELNFVKIRTLQMYKFVYNGS